MPHSKPRAATARAIAAYTARKSVTFATMVSLAIIALVIILIWLLAYYFSAWWWLLVAPFGFLALVFFTVRFIVLAIISKIYRHPFSRTQREKLEEFTSKITSLVAARSTPLPFYAFITIWDIIRHRDATTIRKIIDDSRSLKSDYMTLEKYFGER